MNPISDLRDLHDSREWLEADGLGGFASGTATGIRTRRYHALLFRVVPAEVNETKPAPKRKRESALV